MTPSVINVVLNTITLAFLVAAVIWLVHAIHQLRRENKETRGLIEKKRRGDREAAPR